jgi:hypothetical protein
MFVIMVGHQVLGQQDDKRAAQTYLNTQAVLHGCERLQAHLHAQDLAIRHIVARLQLGQGTGADPQAVPRAGRLSCRNAAAFGPGTAS